MTEETSDAFRPFVAYHHDGDCIEAFWSQDSTISEWVMQGLTIHRSRLTGEVVGVLMDRVETLKEKGMILKGDAIRP